METRPVSRVEVQAVVSAGDLASYVQRFLQAQDVSRPSLRTYERQLRKFLSWIRETSRDRNLNELSREDILEYKSFLQGQGLSSYSVNGYLTSVRKFFAWLEAEKIFPNVAKDVKGLKKAKGFRKDCLNEYQARQVVDVSRGGESLEDLRDHAIIRLLLNTGLRTIEVSRATVEDLRQVEGANVLYVRGKGRDSTDDFVILNEQVYKVIQDYLIKREKAEARKLRDREPLFASLSNRGKGSTLSTRSLSRICKKVLQRAGFNSKRLSAHSFRHTAGTLALKAGAPIQQVQSMLRHSDLKTTMVYAHNLERIQGGAENYLAL